MLEINKFIAKVKNAKKTKSPEIKITFVDAQALLDEINELITANVKPAPKIEKVAESHQTGPIIFDGGHF